MNTHTRDLHVPGGFNVRDLGGYSGQAGETRWRRILRSGGVHRIGDAGVEALRAHGVTAILDLRHAEEHSTQPNPLRAVPGLAFHAVSLFEGLAPDTMAGGDVLLDLYLLALETRAAAFAEAMEVIAAHDDGAILFHCSAGKDRTGLIAALLLSLAGVPAQTIIEDYALTAPRIAPLIAQFLADAESRGTPTEAYQPLLACDPATMAATLAHLDSRHGGAAAYLAAAGVAPETLRRLTARLSEDL